MVIYERLKMLLSFLIHLLVSTVLMGVVLTVALVMGRHTPQELVISVVVGLLLSIPISYFVTKRLRSLK
jgi:hypothetical protein